MVPRQSKVMAVDSYPPTNLQFGMLMHSLMSPGSIAYLQQFIITLEESMNVPAWREAWRKVVDRYDILRTAFDLSDTENPRSIVLQDVSGIIAEYDFRSHSSESSEREFASILDEDRRDSFCPASAPLWRWHLCRLAESEYRLVWTSHHALLDGRSRRLLVLELFQIYNSLLQKKVLELPKPPAFANYARWQSQLDMNDSQHYWRELLRGFTRHSVLPHCGAEIVPKREQIITLNDQLDSATTERIRETATSLGVTCNTIVQGGWALLLSSYCRSSDIVFGAIRACRKAPLERLDATAGLLINTVPVRATISPEAITADWLKGLRSQWVACRPHEQTSLPKIQESSELPSGEALFDTIVSFEESSIDEDLRREISNRSKRSVKLRAATHYPLALSASMGRHLSLEMSIDQDRIDRALGERMLENLKCILRSIVDLPKARLRDHAIMSPLEHQQLARWNATDSAYPSDQCIHELFEQQVRLTPDTVAIVAQDEEWTYQELNNAANRIAHQLATANVKPESVVGICMRRSPMQICGLLGILKAGAAYLPIDVNLPCDRIKLVLDDAEPTAVLTDAVCQRSIELTDYRSPIIDVEQVDGDHHLSMAAPDIHTAATSLAYITFTSGTTGKPKGVEIKHQGVVRLVRGNNYVPLQSLRVAHLSPLSFDASTFEIWGPLLNGGSVVLISDDSMDLASLGKALHRHSVKAVFLTTSLFNTLVEETPDGLKGVEYILTGGEAMSIRHVRKALAELPNTVNLTNVYGPTECTTFATYFPLKRSPSVSERSVPIGKPIANTTAYVLDAQQRVAPIGVAGELCVGGPGLAKGYTKRDRLTSQRFIRNPYEHSAAERLYRTGDLCRWREDGNLEFLGRLDEQVKLRGFRIEPGEVEAVLQEHPDVARAVVVLRENRPGDKRLIGFCTIAEGSSWREDEIKSFLHLKLPDYMIPSALFNVAEIPLTREGKADRRRLAATEVAKQSIGSPEPPQNDAEVKICRVFSDVLDRSIGVDDDFFAMGGHSLLAMKAVYRLDGLFQKGLSLEDLFRYRTARRVAARMENAARRVIPSLVSSDRLDRLPLLLSQLSFWSIYRECPHAFPLNVVRAFELNGKLDLAAMKRTIEHLVSRHESLRTNFGEHEGEPFASVKAAAEIDLDQIDLSRYSTAARQAESRRILERECLHSFALARDPLLRTRIIRLHESKHVLMFNTHHLVFDAVSLAIFNREISGLYKAFCHGEDACLPDLPCQPSDLVRWEQEHLCTAAARASVEYWRQHLGTTWPSEVPPLYIAGNDVNTTSLCLPTPLIRSLKHLGDEEECTFPMVLFAAANLFQYCLFGHEESFVGLPLAARILPESENLISCLRKRLVLRVALSGRTTLRETLRLSRESMISAYSHLDVSQEVVFPNMGVEHALHWTRTPVSINYIKDTSQPLDLAGVETRPVVRPIDVSQVSLNFHVFERIDDTQVVLKGWKKMYSSVELEQLIRHFEEILGCLVTMPEARLDSGGLPSFSKKRRCIDKANE